MMPAGPAFALVLLREAQALLGPSAPIVGEAFISHFDMIAGVSGADDLASILADLVVDSEFDARLESDGFVESRLALYLARLSCAAREPSARLLELLETGLETTGEEVWASDLVAAGLRTRLVQALTDRGRVGWLGDQLLAALTAHAAGLRAGDSEGERLSEFVDGLVASLKPGLGTILLRGIRDDLENGSQELIIACYGDALMSSGVLLDDPDRTTRRIIFKIIDSPTAVTFAWAVALLRQSRYIGSLDMGMKSLLATRMAKLLKSQVLDEQIRELVRESYADIAGSINQPPEQPQPN